LVSTSFGDKGLNLSSPQKVYIIGVGDDGLPGLTTTARNLIENADVLIGSKQTLAVVSDAPGERRVVGADLDEVLTQFEQSADQKLVLLAEGDPLFYGVARFVCDRLGKERFEVIPHVSSMQLAFARVKESWEEAYLTNLANQNLEHVVQQIRTAEKVGLFTTETCPPSQIAQALLNHGIDYFTAYVCENLGSPDERVTTAPLSEIVKQEFSSLNVLILVRQPEVPDRAIEASSRRLFGNPDEMFLQSRPKRGLLTPVEVRAIALAHMDIRPKSTVWDVGAGSGAVAIEAAQMASQGVVYAIEMTPEDYELILANAERFGVGNLKAILGRAPEAWDKLNEPDCIFIGGTGRTVPQMVASAAEQLCPGGRLVANVGSIENLSAVQDTLNTVGDVKIWMINIAHGNHQLERVRFEAMNPTFLIGVTKSHK